MRKMHLTGEVFGWWTVIGDAERDKSGNTYWSCVCKCGTKRNVSGVNLRAGRSLSCGCMAKSLPGGNLSHGKSRTRVYRIWASMVQRATNPKRKCSKNYIERGISISEDWLKFANFYKDMGDPPSDLHSIERVNNDLGYCQENCVWATALEQSRNNRNCRLTTEIVKQIRDRLAKGETGASLAREFLVSESLIRAIKQNLIWQDV